LKVGHVSGVQPELEWNKDKSFDRRLDPPRLHVKNYPEPATDKSGSHRIALCCSLSVFVDFFSIIFSFVLLVAEQPFRVAAVESAIATAFAGNVAFVVSAFGRCRR